MFHISILGNTGMGNNTVVKKNMVQVIYDRLNLECVMILVSAGLEAIVNIINRKAPN